MFIYGLNYSGMWDLRFSQQ